jgi:hypothetical protein
VGYINIPYKILLSKAYRNRSFSRLSGRYYNIKIELKEIGSENVDWALR